MAVSSSSFNPFSSCFKGASVSKSSPHLQPPSTSSNQKSSQSSKYSKWANKLSNLASLNKNSPANIHFSAANTPKPVIFIVPTDRFAKLKKNLTALSKPFLFKISEQDIVNKLKSMQILNGTNAHSPDGFKSAFLEKIKTNQINPIEFLNELTQTFKEVKHKKLTPEAQALLFEILSDIEKEKNISLDLESKPDEQFDVMIKNLDHPDTPPQTIQKSDFLSKILLEGRSQAFLKILNKLIENKDINHVQASIPKSNESDSVENFTTYWYQNVSGPCGLCAVLNALQVSEDKLKNLTDLWAKNMSAEKQKEILNYSFKGLTNFIAYDLLKEGYALKPKNIFKSYMIILQSLKDSKVDGHGFSILKKNDHFYYFDSNKNLKKIETSPEDTQESIYKKIFDVIVEEWSDSQILYLSIGELDEQKQEMKAMEYHKIHQKQDAQENIDK